MTAIDHTRTGNEPVAMAGPVTPAPVAGATMWAIVQDRYGEADVLRMARIDRPQPADSEVLLRVGVAGVSRGVWHLMTGRPYLLRLVFGLRKPKNPVAGQEVAGTVVAIGRAVTKFAIGDEVFGIARGAFAEFAVALEDKIATRPANLSVEQAAVVGVSAITALQALCDVGGVQPGQQVLITGASGGVGGYAVQLAKALGAEVTGVCSTAKLDLVRSLGADHVIDYTRQDFADGARRYDLILDIGGMSRLRRLRSALTPNGTLVLVGGEGGGDWTGGTIGRQLRARTASLFSRQRFTGMLAKERASDLDRLSVFLQAGAVIPSLERTYPLAETANAMRQLAAGTVRGKIAVVVESDGSSTDV